MDTGVELPKAGGRPIRVGAEEDRMSQESLHAYPEESECAQQETDSCEYESSFEGIAQRASRQPELTFRLKRDPDGQRRQNRVHEEPDKGIEQQEPVILQQYKKGQGNSGVMESG